MKYLGELHYCLGLEIWREVGQTLVTRRKYTRDLLKMFNMSQCKEISTPLKHNAKHHSDDGKKDVDGTLYRQLVGSLNYLATTRPDIAYSMIILSQFMSNPNESHWSATKRVFRYLKGTTNFGIKYTNKFDVKLIGYSDSDWAENPDDRKSTT
jgi:hypothetical protein